MLKTRFMPTNTHITANPAEIRRTPVNVAADRHTSTPGNIQRIKRDSEKMR